MLQIVIWMSYGLLYLTVILCTVGAVALCAYTLAGKWSDFYHTRQIPLIKDRARELLWFGTLFSGTGYQYLSYKVRFFADAPLTAVVHHRGRPAAVIGFSLDRKSLRVIQMQGLKGAKLFGIDVDALLVTCAEELAQVLEKKHLCIMPARRNEYYERETRCDVEEHQLRMIARYDEAPQRLGYELIRGWWQKSLQTS